MKINFFFLMFATIFVAPAMAEPPSAAQPSAIHKYLTDASKEVDLQGIVAEFGGGENTGAKTSLEAEYKLAVTEAADNIDLKAALKKHWIKLHQCLSPGINAFDIKKCKYELSGITSEVEVDISL